MSRFAVWNYLYCRVARQSDALLPKVIQTGLACFHFAQMLDEARQFVIMRTEKSPGMGRSKEPGIRGVKLVWFPWFPVWFQNDRDVMLQICRRECIYDVLNCGTVLHAKTYSGGSVDGPT